jgi:hypothetical protein
MSNPPRLTLLHTLHSTHPLRNRPLVGAYYKLPDTGVRWAKVDSKFAIAKMTYNMLGKAWLYNHWTFDEPPAP